MSEKEKSVQHVVDLIKKSRQGVTIQVEQKEKKLKVSVIETGDSGRVSGKDI